MRGDTGGPAIVAWTDGSEAARAALEEAASQARAEGGVLHVVAAHRPGDEPGRTRAREALWAAVEVLPEDLPVRLHTVGGDPASALAVIAEKFGARVTVVHADRRRWRRRPAHEAVELRSPCPVLVVGASPAAPRRARPEAGSFRVMLVALAAVFVALLELTAFRALLPELRQSFAPVEPGTLGWTLDAYEIALVAALVPVGRAADRLSRRRVLELGLALALVASAAAALAPSAEAFAIARAAQGCGAAALVGTSLSLLIQVLAPERRRRAAALWAATGATGFALGPVLGAALADAGAWRWALAAPLVLALAAVAGRRLPADRHAADPGATDVFGSVLLAAAVGLVALGFARAPEWGWGDRRVLGAWAMAAAPAAWLALRSSRHPSPVLESALLRIRSLAVAGLVTLLVAAASTVTLLGDVRFLPELWGYSPLEGAIGVLPGALSIVSGAVVGGALATRLGARWALLLGVLVLAGSAALHQALSGAEADYARTWLPPQLLGGVGAGVTLGALAIATVMDLPRNRLATGTAVVAALAVLGTIVGAAVLAAVFDAADPGQPRDAYDAAYGIVLLTMLGAALLAVLVPRFGEREPGDVPALRRLGRVPYVHGLRPQGTWVDGVPMALRQVGTGSPVLLVHGLFDSSAGWRRVAPALARRHRVLAPDLAGHGGSAAPPGFDYSLGAHAEVLRALLDGLHVDRVTVVGHSLGGSVALEFANRFPDRVERLVLIASAGLGREVSPLVRLATLPGAGMVLRTAGSRPPVAALRLVGRLSTRVRELASTLRRLGGRDSRLDAARAVVGLRGQRAMASPVLRLAREIPLLVLWGTADRVIPCAHAEAVADARPDAEVVLLDGIGHTPQLAQPAFVAERIGRFLDAPRDEPARLRVVASA